MRALLALAAGLPVDPAQIIDLGEKVWKIVEAGKPVTNLTDTDVGSGVPAGIEDWRMMAHWAPSQAQHFTFELKDPMGIKFLNYEYSLSFLYDGEYNSTGKYLAEVRLVPDQVWLNWGAGSFSAEVEVRSVYNCGTEVSPMAMIEVVHRYHHQNIFQKTDREDVFAISGDGTVHCQSGPACQPPAGSAPPVLV